LAALAVILSLLFASPVFAQNIVLKGRDDVSLKAVFSKPAAGKKTVIMLHGWKSGKEEWDPLRKDLEKAGWGTLAYDSRIEGPRTRFIDDVGAALQFLEKEGVHRDKVALAGASLGANVVLLYGALTGFTGPIICLSPGLEYQTLKTDTAIKQVKGPVLLVASPYDHYAHESSVALHKLNPKSMLWTDVKPGHGVQMFDPALLERLVKWLAAH
jgi:pimeloyl-ACP methyl ester carboxylesterase